MGDDRAIGVDRIPAGVIMCSWVLIKNLKSLRPSSRAMTLRSSWSTLGIPTVSITTIPWEVAIATGAVEEMESPNQTRTALGLSF